MFSCVDRLDDLGDLRLEDSMARLFRCLISFHLKSDRANKPIPHKTSPTPTKTIPSPADAIGATSVSPDVPILLRAVVVVTNASESSIVEVVVVVSVVPLTTTTGDAVG